jgi:hypothetical protein
MGRTGLRMIWRRCGRFCEEGAKVFQDMRMKGQATRRLEWTCSGITITMKTAFLQAMVLRRAEISRRWRVTLKDAPVYTALGNPDTLRFMIEPTLDRLFVAVREQPSAGWSPESRVRLVEAASRCALNPMITYFLAGEAALVSVVKEIPPCADFSETEILMSEGELLLALREIGREEITGFCEICSIEAPAKVAHHHRESMPTLCPFKAKART